MVSKFSDNFFLSFWKFWGYFSILDFQKLALFLHILTLQPLYIFDHFFATRYQNFKQELKKNNDKEKKCDW